MWRRGKRKRKTIYPQNQKFKAWRIHTHTHAEAESEIGEDRERRGNKKTRIVNERENRVINNSWQSCWLTVNAVFAPQKRVLNKLEKMIKVVIFN